MNGLADRFASTLERRFLLVAFLPILIFSVSLGVVTLLAAGKVQPALRLWDAQSGSVQVGLTLSTLAVVWLAAGFLDSQLRNLTQLFEGYTLLRLMPRLAESAASRHRNLLKDSSPVHIVDVARGSEADAGAGGPDVNPRETGPDAVDTVDAPLRGGDGGYEEELFVRYPDSVEAVLPTRLGNVIRAAEDYATSRYGADYLVVWPRLAHLCSERFVVDYEATRASLDFLLVVTFLTSVFTVLAGSLVLAFNGPIWLFIGTVVGGALLARLAYETAVGAAVEYGEQIRASMDLFRLALLRQMNYPIPQDSSEEAIFWAEFEDFLKRNHPRSTPYPLAPPEGSASPPGPDHG